MISDGCKFSRRMILDSPARLTWKRGNFIGGNLTSVIDFLKIFSAVVLTIYTFEKCFTMKNRVINK